MGARTKRRGIVMAADNSSALELSSMEMNVLQISIDHMVEHLGMEAASNPSDRQLQRRLDAAHRLRRWFCLD